MNTKQSSRATRDSYRIQHHEKQHGFVALPANGLPAEITPPSDSMPESLAIEQLLRFGRVRGLSGRSALALAGMSDLHPNHPIPVGAALATPRDLVVPSAIGNDINCGMRMVRFDLVRSLSEGEFQKAKSALRDPFVNARREIPLQGAHFRTLFEEGPEAMMAKGVPNLGLWRRMDPQSIAQAARESAALASMRGRCDRMPQALMADRLIRDPGLGTLGSGNHFLELQQLDQRTDRQASYALGLFERETSLYALIHTGSRDVGQWVGATHARWARDAWLAACQSAPEGIFTLEGEAARDYLAAQWAAARYAWLNRSVLQEMARQALEDALGQNIAAVTIADCSHNVVLEEGNQLVHRKGACRAMEGELALIPGSMGDYSYVARGMGNVRSLCSCSHGAGRSASRSAIRQGVATSKLPFEVFTRDGRRVEEEAPWRYMDVERGIAGQVAADIIAPVARMRPICTYKA